MIDAYNPECLALKIGSSLKGNDLVEGLDNLITTSEATDIISVDNGSEFTSKILDQYCLYFHGLKLDLSRPGHSMNNPMMGSSNRRFRDLCLNGH